MAYRKVFLELDDEDTGAKTGVYRNIVRFLSAEYSGSGVRMYSSPGFLDEPHGPVVEIRLSKIEKSLYLEFVVMSLSQVKETALEIFTGINDMFDHEYQRCKKAYSRDILDPKKIITIKVGMIEERLLEKLKPETESEME